jgi:arginine repressor
MFVRAKRSVQRGREYEYLQLVESRREAGSVRQHVLANLGRRDEIAADGTLDRLLQSLARYSHRLRVVEKVRTEGLAAQQCRSWGPALVFGRLWEQQRVTDVLARLVRERRMEFDVERAAFAHALQRLCAPGSDLQGSGWLRTVECPGFEQLELQHLYRTDAFLGEVRESLERELFRLDRDLFNYQLDLVFIDTTSTFVWRDDETELRKRGYSRDRRPDQPQVVLCVAVDQTGWPIAWDILSGNTGDKAAFVAMIERMRKRFAIRRVIVVADRGMISHDAMELLEGDADAPFDFILGCRMRRQKEVSEEVLARAGRYQRITDHLDVKDVRIDDRRYIVCRNTSEAKKDAEARAAILSKLQEQIDHHGAKSLVGNKGYARFLKIGKASVTIDRDAVEADARLDGKFVLRTSTELSAEDVALAYKSLWRVERSFRETKSTLEVRPLFHQTDRNCTGHIVACFLALRLEVDLQRRLDDKGVEVSWPDLMRDLGQVQAVEVTLDGERYRLRTALPGAANDAFAAAGLRPPRTLTHLGTAETANRGTGGPPDDPREECQV